MAKKGIDIAVEIRGLPKLARKMRDLGMNINFELGKALYVEGEQIMGDAKQNYVPVDKGILRASGHVLLPQKGPVVVMGFGGPAVPYAIVQHEALEYKHTVGQAKYLETPALRAAPSMGRRVGARLRKAISKYASR